jgi:tripartite-type tricarboxylate transporter receptor subunit TctC
MWMPRLVAWTCSVGMIIPGVNLVCSQPYPNKPIHIVTSEIGGSPDFMSRLIAQELAGTLGQGVVVDNRGSGFIPGQIVSKAPPDGYTLLIQGSTLWLASLLQKTPYDPEKDFSPITIAVIAPFILVVHPSLPVKSVKEVIALAKTRPGELNYSSGAAGSGPHLAAELFKAMAGVNIVRISYRGTAPALTALISGEVQLTFANAGTATPLFKSGKFRALAVSSVQPSKLFPGLPTIAATLPGYESVSINSVFAPAKTPEAIIKRLNQEIVQFLNKADVKEKVFNAGIEIVGSSPEQLAAMLKSDLAKLGKVIKDTGIRAE